MAQDCVILLLAAGSSSRMRGGDKLLETIQGESLLRRQVKAALATGADVIVTLPAGNPARRSEIADRGVLIVEVADPAAGMSDSIAAGIAALPPHASAAVILPADMPEIDGDDLISVLAAYAQQPNIVHRGSSDGGQLGHPVVFPGRLFPALEMLTGDAGARAILKTEAVKAVPLPDNHAVTDLDTPEEWQAWRQAAPERLP